MNRSGLIWACPVLVFVLAAACGGTTPPPEQPKPEPTVAPPPPPPEPEPEAKEAPKPAEPEEPPEEAAGPKRPMAIYNDPSGAVTVGLDGAVIRIGGGAELRIPGGTMSAARNVVFSVDKRFRGDQGKIGDAYLIEVQVPDQQYQVGEARVSRPFPSSGDVFVVKLPLPSGKDSANLAVETVEVDGKNRGKSTWTIMPQSKLESADTGNKAVFEMRMLPDAHVHLTTKTPTAGE